MPVVNPAYQFLKFPKKEVGLYALDIANLAKNSIPLPTTYCIPVSTLKTIAEHNNLKKKFTHIVNSTNLNSQSELIQASEKAQALIKKQAYPHQVAKKLLQFYDEKLDKDFIRLTASPADGKKIDYKREDNIKGEANMMESILNLWARNIDPTDIKDNNLFPVAIVIQSQTQPDSSGVAYSLNITNGDKSKIFIKSVFGVYDLPESEQAHDTFIIDQRNNEIFDQILNKNKNFLSRQPDELLIQDKPELTQQFSLNKTQALQLAGLVRKIKLSRTDQIKVHWELIEDEIIITKIKPYFYSPAQITHPERYEVLLIGQGVTSGFIAGRCHLIKKDKDIHAVKPGTIAVIKTLDSRHRKLLEICSAIICEQTIDDPALLSKIRDYALPTIILAKHAFSQLKNDKLVTVDASAGKVYQVKSGEVLERKLIKSTNVKLLLAVNNFDEISENLALISSGVGLLRSDHFFIETGQHPLQILKTKPDEYKEKIVSDTVKFFHRFINLKQQEPILTYRASNLDTNQLSKLKGGDIFENIEDNPFLGFRGGLRYLNQLDWFEFELGLLAKINSKIDQPISLLVPFVRSGFELAQLYQHITEKVETPVLQPPLWFEINTPENLLNMGEYLSVPIAGMSLNLKNIHALLHGIDPGFADVYNQYTFNYRLLLPMIEDFCSKLKQNNSRVKINLILPHFSQEILERINGLGISGVVVRPEIAKQVKQFLVDNE